MTFVSYAQNLEDVILRRALIRVQRGFYIDVGAHDPVVDSVSFAFYQQGWRGVHVEPAAHYADLIRAARPDEEVIQAAVSAGEASITFFEIEDTGLSTGSESVAERHASTGRTLKQVSVSAVPLSKILDDHEDKDIHWLKIDVEGMEPQVIESWLPSGVRPWIVLVESVKPDSRELISAAWEPQLLALGYDFVYFDGLNRYYVSAKHLELKASFGPGPNVFDDFVLSGTGSSSFHLSDTPAASRLLIVELSAKNQVLTGRVETLEHELAASDHPEVTHVGSAMRFLTHRIRHLFHRRAGSEAADPDKQDAALPSVPSAVDLSSEPEGARRLYQRLVTLRQSMSGRV